MGEHCKHRSEVPNCHGRPGFLELPAFKDKWSEGTFSHAEAQEAVETTSRHVTCCEEKDMWRCLAKVHWGGKSTVNITL